MNSSELKGYLTGLIFGDGYIDKGVTKRAFAIKSIDIKFIETIKSDIESCTNFNVCERHIPAHEKDGCKHKEVWELRIAAHPYFAKKYHHFYDDNRKRIASREALSWLTPQGLANWYMCDGYICLVGKTKGRIRARRIEICTDRYDTTTIRAMQSMLLSRFGLNFNIIKRGNVYRLRLMQDSYQQFVKLVFPYMIETMWYKLYMGYEYQPKWMDDELWQLQENLRSAIALTGKTEG